MATTMTTPTNSQMHIKTPELRPLCKNPSVKHPSICDFCKSELENVTSVLINNTVQSYDDMDRPCYFGVMCCSSCKKQANQLINEWNEKEAYGDANYLKDKESLKVLRSNGTLENGWVLSPTVKIPSRQPDSNGILILSIMCQKSSDPRFTKWVPIHTLLELNPQE